MRNEVWHVSRTTYLLGAVLFVAVMMLAFRESVSEGVGSLLEDFAAITDFADSDLAGNDIAIEQKGEGNIALADQQSTSKGLANRIQIQQTGTNNYADVKQIGEGNLATILQSGSRHYAELFQQGLQNTFALTQQGHDNASAVSQVGNNNRAVVNQRN